MNGQSFTKWLALVCLALVTVMLVLGGAKKEAPAGPASPVEGWDVIGPGGGGGIFLCTVSPHDPKLMLAHCDMTGAYISHDGGDSWRMLFTWNVPTAFEFDPHDRNVIFVATRGFLWSEDRGSGISTLLRSGDRGKTWKIVYPNMSRADTTLDLLQSREIVVTQVIKGGLDGTVEKVEVDPADNRRIYLGLAPLVSYMSRGGGEAGAEPAQQQAMLMLTEDGCATWRKVADLPGRSILGIFPGSADGKAGEVLVFTESAAAVVDLASGAVTTRELPARRISAAAGGKAKGGRSRSSSADQGTVLYVLSGISITDGKAQGGVFVSRDRGRSWTPASEGLLYGVPEGNVPVLRGLAVCGTAPQVAYISAANSRLARNQPGAWYYGIFKTADYGANWKPVWLADGAGYLTKNMEASWLDRQWGPGWGGNPIDLGIDPSDPNRVFGSDAGRAYRSLDGGKTWKEIDSRINPDGSTSSSGLDVTTCYGVIFDPFDENHFFITYTDIGLFHTYDYGRTWRHSVEGVPRPWTNTCYWLTFDPQVKGRAWAVWGNAHDLPRDKMFSGDGHFPRNQGGVTTTEDGGRTWKRAVGGVPENSVGTCVLVDSKSPSDSRTVYITVFDRGVYKSVDGGQNWSLANNGLGGNLYAWRIIRTNEGRLYLLLSRGRRGRETVDGEVYFSDDKAESWTKVALPAGVNAPHDIQADPAEGKRLYLACWTRQGATGVDAGGGVFRSEDSGATWKRVFDERYRVNSLAVSSQTVFINTFQNSAWRSDDRGETWKRLEGYRFKWGQRPNIDPRHPELIYLSTYGGSVFRGPAHGVPGAVEHIVNMPPSWW